MRLTSCLKRMYTCLLLLGLCLACVEAAAAATSTVRSIVFSSDGSSEKVTIALSRPVSYKAHFLDHNPKANVPYRLFFDLKNATFARGVSRHMKVQGDCVRVVRSALNNARTVRVVLEVKHKLRGDDYKVVQRDNPPALEIILNTRKIIARTGRRAKSVAVTKKPPEPLTYLIAVDAGHGGRDPGAVGYRGLREKKVCLAVAKALKAELDKRSGYRTIMIRTGDQFISLSDRAKLAGEKKADLLISIHGNSHSDGRIVGIETYYLNFSSDEAARKVAARENFTTPEKVGDLEMILFDLGQSDKTNISSLLAGYVQNNIKAVMSSSRYKNFRNLGVKHAPMRVLIEAEMPGILIETGFISSPKESARLQDAAYQRLLAGAIADGVHEFFTSSKTAAFRKQ